MEFGSRRIRKVDCSALVRLRPLPRSRKGRMRAQVTQMNKPRLVLRRKPLKKSIGEKRADSNCGGSLRFGCETFFRVNRHVVALCTYPVRPCFASTSEVELTTESGEDAFVGRQPRIIGCNRAGIDRLIGIAKQHRVVAITASSKRNVVETIIKRRTIHHHSVVHLIRAGVERRSAGRAWRRLSVVLPEAHRLSTERIERWGLHNRMASSRKALGPELIECDEKDVRASLGHSRSVGHGPSIAMWTSHSLTPSNLDPMPPSIFSCSVGCSQSPCSPKELPSFVNGSTIS